MLGALFGKVAPDSDVDITHIAQRTPVRMSRFMHEFIDV